MIARRLCASSQAPRGLLPLRVVCLAPGRRSFSSTTEGGKVGFIGLGVMGAPMAKNLVNKGFKVVVFDKVPETVKMMELLGAASVSSLDALASETSTVISMVPSTAHVRSIYCGDGGLFGLLQKHQKKGFIIDCSTIDPVSAAEINEEARGAGHTMVDAPVSGGSPAAQAGSLTFMVGASGDDFSRAEPYLSAMGKHAIHIGPPGQGAAVKVCNNLILATQMLGVAEGFRLADKLGVDLKTFAQVVNSSSGRSWSSDSYCPAPGVMEGVPASRDYAGGFTVRLMLKDLGLAQQAGEVTGTDLFIANKTAQVYKDVEEQGHGDLDFGCVFKFGRDQK
uniref:3-hydroxyisobutyrate dehydrogenase n=1 Tax=Chromera velia CCMP2878 TaxID=1169474 RepID=A0A0G4HAD7_9ALVE|eukprot:Cvel_887.t1-p1 / transcript=Cvel_887.t1 / gene=Cvel_887 / organism=Chromera_velia_CCMP2878 / gene_product=Probable 3-hydroxyisobutyrate dehydrogenase,, putative / transcript_product=Probable 3-hydroxyisobutyrate dehydrogenase,, putative / location=Cvel_scaffold28:47497-48501(+) / protein_length=335 / sequence_SO=supercontig / SO=protein_coding / is_pseudo=false